MKRSRHSSRLQEKWRKRRAEEEEPLPHGTFNRQIIEKLMHGMIFEMHSSGKECGFIICGNGKSTINTHCRRQTQKSLVLPKCYGRKPIMAFHTHPGGSLRPSVGDLFTARRKGVRRMCIGAIHDPNMVNTWSELGPKGGTKKTRNIGLLVACWEMSREGIRVKEIMDLSSRKGTSRRLFRTRGPTAPEDDEKEIIRPSRGTRRR